MTRIEWDRRGIRREWGSRWFVDSLYAGHAMSIRCAPMYCGNHLGLRITVSVCMGVR